MRSLLLALLVCCAVAAGVGAQSRIYVDPASGVDAPGNGSASQPCRTLTYALTQTGGAMSPVFVLRPGRYGAASGEQFPLRLPDLCRVEIDDRVIAPDSRSVVLDPPQGGVAVFTYAPARTGVLTLAGLSVQRGRLLDIQAQGRSSFPFVTVRGCWVQDLAAVGQDAAVETVVEGGAVLTLHVRDSEFASAGGGAVGIDVASGSAYQLHADRCRFSGGDAVLDFDGRRGGFGVATLRACEIVGGLTAGIRSSSDLGADLLTKLEHVLVADCGHTPAPVGSRGAALLVDHVGRGPFPAHDVLNSIFAGNAADAPVSGQGCTFGVNLVEQADLALLGGNQLGTATFVDPAAGNYRLLPGSVGVDAADGSVTTLFADLDGEPRNRPGELPDLGPDEYHQHSLHLESDSRNGGLWEFVVRTDPGTRFALLVGEVAGGAAFGVGRPHLDGIVFPTGLGGTADQDGIGRITLPVPADPGLVGLELFWQPVVVTAPFWGANAWRTVVR